MLTVGIIYLAAGAAVTLFFILFGVTSIAEKKPRAAGISFALAFIFGLIWFGTYFFMALPDYTYATAAAVVVIAIFLFFLPIGRRYRFDTSRIDARFDERDVMFAREEYEPGTEKYEKYYAMRPENKKADDKIRSLPELLTPGGRYYDADRSALVVALFDQIEKLTTQVDGPVNETREKVDPVAMTREIKEALTNLGADEVGVARLNPMHVYSHVGRGPETWGGPIENNHKYVIAFTLEMDYAQIEQAPRLAVTEETVRQYYNAALTAIAVAETIRERGYPARAHISESNYQVIMPAVARDAGLGELGRNGYLISPRFGTRIRLGAVTTDLPLVTDRPIAFGVQEFCEICKKCAVNCPSRAIPLGDRVDVRGLPKWQLDVERCITYWRLAGTDCGLCMKVCPFSHPGSIAHDIIRAGIKRSAFARYLSIYGDDLFYGRKFRYFRGH